jgi:hypothetical protein
VADTAVLESMVVGMHERMVGLAGRFRRGVATLAARLGEEAPVGMLQRQAAKSGRGARHGRGAGENECQDMIM